MSFGVLVAFMIDRPRLPAHLIGSFQEWRVPSLDSCVGMVGERDRVMDKISQRYPVLSASTLHDRSIDRVFFASFSQFSRVKSSLLESCEGGGWRTRAFDGLIERAMKYYSVSLSSHSQLPDCFYRSIVRSRLPSLLGHCLQE